MISNMKPINNTVLKYQNILLIRAGNSHRKKIKHPVHYAPCLPLKYAQKILQDQGQYNITLLDYWVDPPTFDGLMDQIQQQAIDLIVVSIGSPSSEAAIELCRKIKKKKALPIVAVGSDVSEKHRFYLSLPELFDVIIRGEFEIELNALINRLNSPEDFESVKAYYNQIKSNELIQLDDIDELPVLDWSKDELTKYPYIYPMRVSQKMVSGYISTSRGCPHACTFCSPTVRKSYGRKLRTRSPEKVVEEIERLTRIGVNVVSFEDDDFVLNKDHVTKICEEIVRRNLKIKWACHARVDEVPPELLTVMKNAGCELLLFGIESGSQKIVNVLHKASFQAGWRQKVKEAFDNVRRAGIASCAMFIVGSPTESEHDIQQSIDLCQEIQPNLVKVHFFTLYPGSVDYKRYSDKSSELQSPHHYLKPIVNLSQIDLSALKKIQRVFYKKILFRPSFVFSHLYNYLPYYLSNSPGSLKLVKDGIMFLIHGENEKMENSVGVVSPMPVRS